MNKTLKNMVISALFLAIGFVLPFFTGQIKEIGNMLLPMHLPVLLCGLVCGYKYGLAVGFILPVSRSLIFSMPVIYPTATAMAFELATYGFVIGILFAISKKQNLFAIYRALIAAMIAGRIVWGIAQSIMLGFAGNSFGISAFVAGAFLNAIPGIILQLILVPSIVIALDRVGAIKLRKGKENSEK